VPLQKISHLMLVVRDLDRSLAFYRDTLGMRVNYAIESLAFLDGGGVTLALRKAQNFPVEPNQKLTEVVFEVDDIHAAYNELKSRGVEFRLNPRVLTGDAERELWGTDFCDPDGHVLSITGWVAKN